eukprot:m.265355 g.265355  ORF g.265355 m.265355 type:complete len:444 (-) comp61393_c0_seq1:24-1355(-)
MVLVFKPINIAVLAVGAVAAPTISWLLDDPGFDGDVASFVEALCNPDHPGPLGRLFLFLMIILGTNLFVSIGVLTTTRCFLGRSMNEPERKEIQRIAGKQVFFGVVSIPMIVSFHGWLTPAWLCWSMAMVYVNSLNSIGLSMVEQHSTASYLPHVRTTAMTLFALGINILMGYMFYVFYDVVLEQLLSSEAPNKPSGGLGLTIVVLSENVRMLIESTCIILRCLIQVKDRHSGFVLNVSTKELDVAVDFFMLAARRLVTLLHDLYLISLDITLGFLQLLLFMRVRKSVGDISSSISRRRERLRTGRRLEALYSLVTPAADDNKCAICWEQMTQATLLPCKHHFHRDCLRNWLEEPDQQSSCPICRLPLEGMNEPEAPEGDTWFSWMMSHAPFGFGLAPADLERMTNQVQEMFPQILRQHIINDLTLTGSTEITIGRILAGHVT